MMMKMTMMIGIAIRMIFSIGFLVIKFGLMGRARSGLTCDLPTTLWHIQRIRPQKPQLFKINTSGLKYPFVNGSA
jgi:hypothetical protein